MSEVDKETRGRINPVYILLDIGKNMWGKPIETAVRVIRSLIDELKTDPEDLEKTWLSFLTVGSDVEIVMPLTEILLIKDIKVSLYDGIADTDIIDRYMARLFEENLKKRSLYKKNDYSPRVIWFSTGLHKNFEDVSSERESLWGEWGTFVNKIYFITYDVSGDNIDIKSQAYLLYNCIGATDIWRQEEHYEMKYVLSGDNVAELDNPKMVKINFPQAHNMT